MQHLDADRLDLDALAEASAALTSASERRQVYRTSADQELIPAAWLIRGELILQCAILDISAEGCGLLVDRGVGPKLRRMLETQELGELRLILDGGRLPRRLLLACLPRHVEPVAGGVRLGLHFALVPEQRAILGERLLEAFNRRRAVRVAPDPEQPVSFLLSADCLVDPVPGLVRDLSATGLGIALPAAKGTRHLCGATVRLQLQLPESGSVTVGGQVAWCMERRVLGIGEHAIQSLCFAGVMLKESRQDSCRESQALTRYVVARQLAWLRSRRDLA